MVPNFYALIVWFLFDTNILEYDIDCFFSLYTYSYTVKMYGVNFVNNMKKNKTVDEYKNHSARVQMLNKKFYCEEDKGFNDIHIHIYVEEISRK